MQIDIYSDVICPWCFIGKRRLERALSARPGLAVALRWRPFQLNPEMPPGGMDRQEYLAAKFGGAERAQTVYDRVLEAADQEGLGFDMGAIRRTPSTLNAHRLIRFAGPGPAQNRVVEALFRAYFCHGRDVGEVTELVDIATDSGLDGPAVRGYLESDREVGAIQAEDLRARLMGVDGVPCFVVDDRYALPGAVEPRAFLAFFDRRRDPETGARRAPA
jgi:predicted DsbA family dithiol-disulfide isomerase